MADLFVFPPVGSDAEMFAEIDLIAEQIGATASDADSPAGHYSAVRDFGPVLYRAVAIPHSARNESEGRNNDAAAPHPLLRRPLAVTFTAGLLLAVIGIQRGDHGKRLTGQPDGRAEAFARRLLTGSRGCDPRRPGRPPMSRVTDLTAAVVVLPPGTAPSPAATSAAPGPAGCAARRGAPASPRTVPPATGRGDVR